VNPYVVKAMSQFDDPRDAWFWSLQERERNPDPELANAEHFLYNRFYSQQGPLEQAAAFVTPIGYYAKKRLGLTNSRSPASLEQMKMGLLGAMGGLLE